MFGKRFVMNVVRLMGGLGNQLFQYAFGKAMTKNGIAVAYDISKFARGKHRSYMLDRFTINVPFSNFINSRGHLDTGANPSYSAEYLKRDGYNFFGYWQYLAYFESFLPELKKEIWINKERYTGDYLFWKMKILKDDNSVSVHVRRDDYLTSSTISPVPLSYYYEAFSTIKGNYYFFSDDIEWCKEKFKQEYFEGQVNFIHLDFHLDFELMRLCRHHILANSTFSWWAAILDGDDRGTVITPDVWITKYDKAERNNFPEKWVKIKV